MRPFAVVVATAVAAPLSVSTASAQSAAPAPYTVRSVTIDTMRPWRRPPSRHDSLAAVLGLPPLAAAELPPGWREARISAGGDDGMRRSYAFIRVVWTQFAAQGEVVRWWRVLPDSLERRFHIQPPDAMPGFDWRCRSTVEANSIRACVIPFETAEPWQVAGDQLDKALWGPRITGLPSDTLPRYKMIPWPPGSDALFPGSVNPARLVTRVDTIMSCWHCGNLFIERRQGSRYSVEFYRQDIRRRTEYDDWMEVLDKVGRLLHPRIVK